MSFVQDVGLNLWKQSRMALKKPIKLYVEIHVGGILHCIKTSRFVLLNTGRTQVDPTLMYNNYTRGFIHG
jgi:hypothetical protein